MIKLRILPIVLLILIFVSSFNIAFTVINNYMYDLKYTSMNETPIEGIVMVGDHYLTLEQKIKRLKEENIDFIAFTMPNNGIVNIYDGGYPSDLGLNFKDGLLVEEQEKNGYLYQNFDYSEHHENIFIKSNLTYDELGNMFKPATVVGYYREFIISQKQISFFTYIVLANLAMIMYIMFMAYKKEIYILEILGKHPVMIANRIYAHFLKNCAIALLITIIFKINGIKEMIKFSSYLGEYFVSALQTLVIFALIIFISSYLYIYVYINVNDVVNLKRSSND